MNETQKRILEKIDEIKKSQERMLTKNQVMLVVAGLVLGVVMAAIL